MRILLVLTGGTISTVVENNVMGIRGNSPYLIVERYQEEYQKRKGNKEEIEFDVIEPVRMLSECNQPGYLEKIYYGILTKLGLPGNYEELRKKDTPLPALCREEIPYDGIIVTHGSDTLSYSAAFFATVFSWIDVPFVLTAADYPISDERSNGMRNFSDSVDFIRTGNQAGVFVVWQNQIPGANLFLASRLLEADTCRDCFYSFTGQPFGEIRDGNCVLFEKTQACIDKQAVVSDLHMESDVLFLRPYPGLRYDFLSLENKGIRAVVHYLYHSATACTESKMDVNFSLGQGENYNILEFAEYCKRLSIDFYLAGFKSADQHLYDTNALLLKSGLGKPLYGLSPEMAYMKVLAAYNQTAVPVEEFLGEAVTGLKKFK